MKRLSKTKWRWKPKRWWIGLLAFWFICTLGAGIIARTGGTYTHERGLIIGVMVAVFIWTASTDRGWNILLRAVWVIGLWVIHAILSLPIALTLGSFVYSVRPHLVDRTVTFLAAAPLVILAMRRSKFFVEPITKRDGE